ncbi:MAG: SLBB domain-containing protein, partial [Candidatus Omnitrophica bacterium]|nr:SLBB domain-containing protein [Candidatus Omnitrophota bacterium]
TRRTFKAYIDFEDPKELTSPYDGTKFFPTPELIISKPQTGIPTTGMPGLYGGSLHPMPADQFPYGDSGVGAPTGMAPATGGFGGQLMLDGKPSRIEEIFSKNIPLGISKDIKQFGYEIFKPVEKAPLTKEGEAQAEGETGSGKGNLLKTLLGSGAGSEILPSDFGMTGGPSVFTSPTEIPVISDYVLGPGDTLKVTIWGQAQEIFSVVIDPEGKILLPKAGPMYLWGLKFSEAEERIKKSLLKTYANIQVSVSMGGLRGIKVFVLGEAKRPGAYTISALSNSFHALYAAGGPGKLGSMRKIKLTRKGAPGLSIDLYDLLLKGDNSQDYKLQANDTIFIPPIGDTVGVAGNVKRPAIYELSEKTKLSDVMEMAGGISSVGYLKRIQLERIQDHQRKIVLDLEFKSLIDLRNSQNNLELQDGDLVLVFPITSIRHNFVSIAGNILRTGDYELKDGMRLKDLIDKAGGILPGTYLKRAEISRFRGDRTKETIPVSLTELMDGIEEANIPLKEWDVVRIYTKREILPSLFVMIDGAVDKPGKYELTENMRISDLIFRAGGLKRNAFMLNGELFRSFADPAATIFNIDFNKALAKYPEEPNEHDLFLEEGDHLFVREDTSKKEKFIITFSGEFKYPGKYAVEKGARFSSVIKRAGGFKDGAFLDGCVFTRASVRKTQERALKNFLDSEQSALLKEQSSLAVGLTPMQAESRDKLITYRKELREKLGNVAFQGRVLIKLNSDMAKFVGSEYDMVIQDGDSLHIPSAPSTVQVVGNVYGAGTVAFSKKKGVDYYINKVGGLTRYADANRIFVIRANGETISHFVRAVKIKRGDIIIVPEEFKYRTLPGLVVKDVVQVIYQATLGAAVTITALNSL